VWDVGYKTVKDPIAARGMTKSCICEYWACFDEFDQTFIDKGIYFLKTPDLSQSVFLEVRTMCD
jgi:hypothetical protein